MRTLEVEPIPRKPTTVGTFPAVTDNRARRAMNQSSRRANTLIRVGGFGGFGTLSNLACGRK